MVFQQFFKDLGIAIIIYDFSEIQALKLKNAKGSSDKELKPCFDGRQLLREQNILVTGTILLLHHENHYDFLKCVKSFVESRGFCEGCYRLFNRLSTHNCEYKCMRCYSSPQCVKPDEEMNIKCNDCNYIFESQLCFDNHKKEASFNKNNSVCSMVRKCAECFRKISKDVDGNRKHKCGFYYCEVCKEQREYNHLCYMPRYSSDTTDEESDAPDDDENGTGGVCVDNENPAKKRRKTRVERRVQVREQKRIRTAFIYYDFETRQDKTLENGDHIHETTLCVAQRRCAKCADFEDSRACDHCFGGDNPVIFDGENPVQQFVNYVLDEKYRKNIRYVTCIAHNARGFDAQFILKHLMTDDSRALSKPPSVILRGTSILLLQLSDSRIGETRFIDSLNYFPMKLSALPAAFGFSNIVGKGWCPHTIDDQEYVGPIPDEKYFSPEKMSVKEALEFRTWHGAMRDSGYIYDFKKELLAYCKIDVDILRRACSIFQRDFLGKGNVDPFTEAFTIATACNKLYRKNFLEKDTIGIMGRNGYRLVDQFSREAIEWLYYVEYKDNIKLKYALRSLEHRVECGFKVDGYYEKSHSERIVYQYHGCYWHGCPRCHPSRRNSPMKGGETMEDRYSRTLKVKQRLEEKGYEVIEMWSCDWYQIRNNDHTFLNNLRGKKWFKNEPLDPRDAFFGGRTENTRIYWKAEGDERGEYMDIKSMYPHWCKNGLFPKHHPIILIDDEEINEYFERHTWGETEGFIKCRILPPQNLLYPVLPVRMHGKLMFPLCRMCCENANNDECNHSLNDREFVGTWVIGEVRAALEHGYKISEIQEMWVYECTAYDKISKEGGLFVGYINLFMGMKEMASGWPAECKTPQQREAHIAEFFKNEGVVLNAANIEYNEAARTIAKLCLNSFWGKFGQRDDMGQTEIVNDPAKLRQLLVSHDKEVMGIVIASESVLYVNWRYKEGYGKPSSTVSVAIAAFTTYHARMHLLSYLDKLGNRVLYYDTDSCMYTTSKVRGEESIETGVCFGDMQDELGKYGENAYISEFASCGPKFYSIAVNNEKGHAAHITKIKGFSMNSGNADKFNHESVKRLALGEIPELSDEFTTIRRTVDHDVVTRLERKTMKTTSSKRIYKNLQSVPYGFKN